MICPHCQQPVEPQTKLCPHCNKKIKQTKNTKPLLGAVLITLLALVLILGTLFRRNLIALKNIISPPPTPTPLGDNFFYTATPISTPEIKIYSHPEDFFSFKYKEPWTIQETPSDKFMLAIVNSSTGREFTFSQTKLPDENDSIKEYLETNFPPAEGYSIFKDYQEELESKLTLWQKIYLSPEKEYLHHYWISNPPYLYHFYSQQMSPEPWQEKIPLFISSFAPVKKTP